MQNRHKVITPVFMQKQKSKHPHQKTKRQDINQEQLDKTCKITQNNGTSYTEELIKEIEMIKSINEELENQIVYSRFEQARMRVALFGQPPIGTPSDNKYKHLSSEELEMKIEEVKRINNLLEDEIVASRLRQAQMRQALQECESIQSTAETHRSYHRSGKT